MKFDQLLLFELK